MLCKDLFNLFLFYYIKFCNYKLFRTFSTPLLTFCINLKYLKNSERVFDFIINISIKILQYFKFILKYLTSKNLL